MGHATVRSCDRNNILAHVFDNVQAHPPAQPGDDRRVRPPRPVRIDLPALFGSGPEVHPGGWRTAHPVDGDLHTWGRDTSGRWIALVRYTLRRGDGPGMTVTHWVPSSMVEPR